jgi:type IV secretion system protein TrbJ
MQIRTLATTLLVLGVGYLAVNPEKLHALLGIGDLVFDPSSYASLGEIWSEDASNGVKLAETYNQTVMLVKQGLQIYNLGLAMSQRIESKQVWEMAAFAVGNEITESHYNEKINFNAVMNGDFLNAGTAWHQSTLYGGDGSYLGASQAATSRRMSNYATLQLLDQTSQRCGEILANYKATQDMNQGAEDQLSADTFDQSDAKNSMVAVLNVLSGGRVHMQTQTRANGNLQACQAEQQTLTAKIQRDKLADEQLWYSDIANTRATSPALLDPDLTASVVANYLIP